MPEKNVVKHRKAARRRRRVRGKVFGTPERPRLTVNRSLRNVYVQVIDDIEGKTLIGVGSLSKAMEGVLDKGDKKMDVAKKVGQKAAELCQEKGIMNVVFDRNQFRYHGRIRAVAEGAREGGLKF